VVAAHWGDSLRRSPSRGVAVWDHTVGNFFLRRMRAVQDDPSLGAPTVEC
jgi:hypothetical protein